MIAHQIQKLTIAEVRPGMYVGNVFNERGTLLYSANTLINNFAQIEALRRQGVCLVSINVEKGDSAKVGPMESQPPEAVAVNEDAPVLPEPSQHEFVAFEEQKISETVAMRDKVLTTMHSVMNSAKTGRLFSITSIAKEVEFLVESMLDEPDILLNLSQIKSHYTPTYIHSVNVAVLMVGFAAALGYPEEKILDIGIGGLLHDIGVVRLPEGLMHRQGVYTRQEAEQLKRHPKLGLEILSQNAKPVPGIVRNIVAQHHERLNGGGYPAYLTHKKIDEGAMICAIADMYDSLTTQGMYQKTYLPQEALALIFQGADDDFPRELVEHFTKLLGIYPVGSFVKLDSGEMGVVVKNNRRKLLTPLVRVLFDADGNQLITPYLKDLALAEPLPNGKAMRVERSIDPRMYHVTISRDFL